MSGQPSLAERQAAFMAQVLDEASPLPDGWGERHAAGLQIYRGNYRSSLVEALKSTFEKTQRWVGEDAFQRAAAHHVISHPPTSWTLDDAGAGFDGTCAELFRNDPEVEEIAWLEWAMLQAFVAANIPPLDRTGFSAQTAHFAEADWTNLRIEFLPGVATRAVRHDLRLIWNALGKENLERPESRLETRQSVLVWREDERSTFMMGMAEEARALAAMQSGMTYGEICLLLAGDDPDERQATEAAMRAGALLGRWLNEGLVAAIHT